MESILGTNLSCLSVFFVSFVRADNTTMPSEERTNQMFSNPQNQSQTDLSDDLMWPRWRIPTPANSWRQTHLLILWIFSDFLKQVPEKRLWNLESTQTCRTEDTLMQLLAAKRGSCYSHLHPVGWSSENRKFWEKASKINPSFFFLCLFFLIRMILRWGNQV